MAKKRGTLISILVICLIISVIGTSIIFSTSHLFAADAAKVIDYTIKTDTGNGATIDIIIKNIKPYAISDWTLTWEYAGNQKIDTIWGADFKQNGSKITVTPAAWSKTIAPNETVSFGFSLGYSGNNEIPKKFNLNASAFSISDNVENVANTDINIKQLKWTSADQWGKISTNGYTIYNNIWGGGAGKQTVWANSFKNWGVFADHPNTGGIKSYPNCEREVNTKLSALKSCKSTFKCTVPKEGAYNTAYDIWCNNYTYEIMLWMNWNGKVGPIARSWNDNGDPIAEETNTSIGGHSWNIYKGTNGSNQVFSFLRTSQTNSGTVDIKAICDWIKSKGWYDDVTLYKVQLGWEITSSNGGLDFSIDDFSVDYN